MFSEPSRRSSRRNSEIPGPCYSVGIDENGLGPLLGPLIVTGVALDISCERLEPLKNLAPDIPSIDDSKKVFSQRSLKKGESLALALIGTINRAVPASFRDLLAALHCEATGSFPFPCLTGETEQFCMAQNPTLPLWCEPGDVERVGEELGRGLKEAGLGQGCIVSAAWCPLALNRKVSEGTNKFDLDLQTFLRITRVFQDLYAKPVDVVAGKVGSRVYYSDAIEGFFGQQPEILGQASGESAYRLGSNVRLRFVMDADNKFMHVSMASIVGKYLREVFMEAIFRFFRGCGDLRRPSGYRDPVTKEFIRMTEGFLSESGVSPACVKRVK